MREFLSFLAVNWHLTALFVGILLAIIITEIRFGAANTGGIPPEAMTKLINREHAIVFDIRDETSYQSGHVVGAIQIDREKIEESMQSYQKSKTKPIVVVNQDGKGLNKVLEQLKANGFTQVVSLRGGIAAWAEAGYPLVKSGE